jgi:regulator of protease activity HflC (stomatin/prohibitin superfamily)
MDDVTLVTLHEKYRGMEGVEERLIKPAAIKAIYNSGPLMSSKESAGKRRGDLIEYISDQATRGVYKTNQRKDETEDLTAPPVEIVEMTLVPELDAQGKPKLDDKGNPVMRKDPQRILKPRMKTVTVVEPARDEKGNVLVQEESATTKFGIKVFNITIEHIVYEEKVQEQINKQRDMEMAIQTKISEAEQAKQEAITAEQRGKAESASAKWAQEVVKAKAVTEAEMQRLVAEEDLKTAGLEKKAKIERAEGDAQAKKLIMDADGSLDKKLEAWKSVNAAYAEAFKSQPLVPEIVIGSSGAGNGAVNANDLIALMAAQTAKQIGLDLKFKK